MQSVTYLFHIYTSFMARYDLYTDFIFALNTFLCEELKARIIGLYKSKNKSLYILYIFIYLYNKGTVSLTILGMNLSIQIVS